MQKGQSVMRRIWIIAAIGGLFSFGASADCQIIDGSKKTPYEGSNLSGIAVEKKSLIALNKQFPNLHVVESIFKGEIQTCVNCTGKYISCSD